MHAFDARRGQLAAGCPLQRQRHSLQAAFGLARPRLLLRAPPTRASSSEPVPAQQQQQQHQPQRLQQQPAAAAEHHIDQDLFDLNYWHYQPWWLQPPMIVGSGLAFLAASLLLDDEPTAKTALLAAGPLALYWGIFLFLMPRKFKSFAVRYMETHPEAEEAALAELEQQQQLHAAAAAQQGDAAATQQRQ